MLNDFLQKSLKANGYHLADEITLKLLNYIELLERWNRVYNLTAIRDPKEMVSLHILDSLAVNPYLHGTRLLDVGTGAGLPGIPLALLNPDKQFVLMDSNSKKTRFLTQAIAELNIPNIQVVHERCEKFKPERCFDSIISRAFASLEVMLSTTQHLICQNGLFLAMKGLSPTEELSAISPEFTVLGVHKLMIKGLEAERCLVIIKRHFKEKSHD